MTNWVFQSLDKRVRELDERVLKLEKIVAVEEELIRAQTLARDREAREPDPNITPPKFDRVLQGYCRRTGWLMKKCRSCLARLSKSLPWRTQ
ncbi:hypothetical protein ES703_81563 [subsurface metagenome]